MSLWRLCNSFLRYAATCAVTATTFQGQCTSFITALQQKTGGQVTATTDAQVAALVSQLRGANMVPSAGCCTAAINLFKNVRLTSIFYVVPGLWLLIPIPNLSSPLLCILLFVLCNIAQDSSR